MGSWSSVRATPDGVPLLVADPEGYLAQVGDEATVPLGALPFEALAHLARYLPHVAAAEGPLRAAVRELLSRHAPPGAALGVEAGCSVGPDLRALRAVCDEVIAFDLSVAAARAARALVAGEAVPLPVRVEGRSFTLGAPLQLPEAQGVSVVVGSALDPPLHAGVADVVMAINLVDNVPEPINLLGQLDAIAKPGALLLLASPFSWQDAITAPGEQLGGGTIPGFVALGSPAALRAVLRGETPFLPWLDYEILEAREARWSLRDHARAVFTYDVHLLAARKR